MASHRFWVVGHWFWVMGSNCGWRSEGPTKRLELVLRRPRRRRSRRYRFSELRPVDVVRHAGPYRQRPHQHLRPCRVAVDDDSLGGIRDRAELRAGGGYPVDRDATPAVGEDLQTHVKPGAGSERP